MTEAVISSRPKPLVLVVIGQLEIGGAETHLARILPELRHYGIEVSVFALKKGGSLEGILETRGVRVQAHPGRRSGLGGLLRAAVYLRQVIRREQPQVLHCFLPAAYLVGTLATVGIPLRRVMSRRSLSSYQSKHPGLRWLERQLHKHMSVVLANSRAVALQLMDEGVAPAHLGLIYNGVPRVSGSSGRAAVRQRLCIGERALVLVCVANLIAYKGHSDLLDALAIAQPSLPEDWTLILVGRDDGIGSQLRAQARALRLTPHLRLAGAVSEPADYLVAADIGVLASHQEGFSNAVLEGMSAGLPMLVTDVGGNSEAILDGQCGRVVPPGSPAALAAALVELAKSPELRRSYGERARERVTERFSVEQCVGLYRDLYMNLVSGAEPPIPPGARFTP